MEDQRPATYEHVQIVQQMIGDVIRDLTLRIELTTQVIRELVQRGEAHDQSKLHEPERSFFDKYTPKLRGMTYDSPEYQQCLAELKPALEHHYATNRHHPEHFTDGIQDMNLVDVVEMLVDWKAASMRHADGDIRVSIEKNQKRFGYDDSFKRLLHNTIDWLEPLLEARNQPPAGGPPG